jgi:hypothetical protein
LIVIEQIHPEDARPATAHSYARDTITLGWDGRFRARGHRRSDVGAAFGRSLPRGTIGYSDGLEAPTAAGLVQDPGRSAGAADVCLDEVVGAATDWPYASGYPALK